jgi:glucosamine-6-phosphate deaminase
MQGIQYDLLKVRVYPERGALGAASADFAAATIRSACAERGAARVVFACAPSQNEFLAALVRMPVDWSLVTIFHMDEYEGLLASQPQSFRSYLTEHLLAMIGPARGVHLIGAEGEASRECDRYAALLAEAQIDLVCLGIGENGHLAFNDPPVADFCDPQLVKVVDLDPACRRQQVNDGCFATLDEVPSRALTLTIPALLGARTICGVVPGERKAGAVRETLLGPVSTQCPASILRTHPQAVLHLDSQSAALLRPL